MFKKKEEEAPAGCPAWLATYGDLVTLVLTFFVLLYSMSNIDSNKLAQVVASYSGREMNLIMTGGADGISDLLGNGILEVPTSRRSGQIINKEPSNAQAQAEMAQMASDFKTYFAEFNLEERVEVTINDNSITMNFKDDMLFDSGRADLKQDAIFALDIISAVLFEYPGCLVGIEGHTDNVPISTSQFPSNWYLSSARAIKVGEYFINTKGIPPSRISATGRGEYVPVAPNDTPENRMRNRRVEITILSSYNSEFE